MRLATNLATGFNLRNQKWFELSVFLIVFAHHHFIKLLILFLILAVNEYEILYTRRKAASFHLFVREFGDVLQIHRYLLIRKEPRSHHFTLFIILLIIVVCLYLSVLFDHWSTPSAVCAQVVEEVYGGECNQELGQREGEETEEPEIDEVDWVLEVVEQYYRSVD